MPKHFLRDLKSVVDTNLRANTLHYICNNQRIKDGELVLVDAGAEYHGYVADLSRTWPINGRCFIIVLFSSFLRILKVFSSRFMMSTFKTKKNRVRKSMKPLFNDVTLTVGIESVKNSTTSMHLDTVKSCEKIAR